MLIDYYDTSALLAKPELIESNYNIYVSHFVIKELEDIKQSSNKSENIKASARKISRILRRKMSIRTDNINYKKLCRIKKHNPWLPQNTDGDIIAEAMLLREEGDQVCFWTADYNMYLFARDVVSYINFVETEAKREIEPWSGWGKYYPNEKDMNILYSEPTINILGAKINEYCEIFEGKELKDVLRWDGEKYCKLKYKDMKTALGEIIKPRNLEQKMYFDMLQNKDIPIKCCVSSFGTGKSLIALTYALQEVQKGRFDKIVFVKNNLEVKGAGRLGIMPGDELSKQYPWLRQIEDHIGYQRFEEYLETGIIEPAHLSTLRGRDLKNSCILCDEAENLLASNIQLLLGRVGDNSEIIFCGDIKQCDYRYKEESGIPLLIERLAGNPLFGMVKLLKTERSSVAATADLLD